MERVIVFWDYSNFVINLRQVGGPEAPRQFDMAAFVTRLLEGKRRIRTYLVGSEGHPNEHAFFGYADRLPYFYVKSFPRRTGPDGRGREKQVDVYLATEIVALAYEDAYDVAYLISGDEDYVPAIERVHAKGKQVIAVTFRDALSGELRKKADEVIELDSGGETNPVFFKHFLP